MPSTSSFTKLAQTRLGQLHREAEKGNHFSFMNKSFSMQCHLTKFSTLIVKECSKWFTTGQHRG